MARSVAIGGLRRRPPFSELFQIDPKVRGSIAADMRQRGYDESDPIVVWDRDGELVVVDGHTRIEAAMDAGLAEIVIVEQGFDDELAALTYTLHKQRDRRNLTGEELVKVIAVVDASRRRARGGAQQNPYGTNQYTGKVAHHGCRSSVQ